MDHLYIAQQLETNKNVFTGLFQDVSSQQYVWKPTPEKWCLLEIGCHLYDEEREDFRARIQHTLQNPESSMPPIDPQGWVISRKYMERNCQQVLSDFLSERDTSISFLRSLQYPNWDNVYHHPKLGEMPAQLFLENWLAHDYLHIRQITATKYLYLKAHSKTHLDYAGNC